MSGARKRRRTDPTGRSLGDGKHVRLYRWVLKSAAWRSLSPVARSILIELYDLYDGQNNGNVFLSVRRAALALNIGKNAAAVGLKQLQERGFIKARQKGAFSLKARHATTWVLTEFEFADQLATKDFTRWVGREKPVPLEGQAVPHRGQTFPTTALDEPNCPPQGTD